MSVSSLPEMFRPPVDRAMRVLDRSFFQKKVPVAAARVFDNRHIAPCRSALAKDVLKVERLSVVQTFPSGGNDAPNRKALLLDPKIRSNDPSTWGSSLQRLVDEKKVEVTSYDLYLDYGYWDYLDIMTAILPEDAQEELPTGFSIAGHVAHLNLRSQYLPHKHLIAEILMDKNPSIRTVINKTEEVGVQSEYRTFDYEILAGDPSLDVEVKEQNCTFRFNYSQVYWNSRLNTEHERLVNLFHPGEAVCDVMAGVGPFAVPAGKKQVFVWANDLNPASFESLTDAIKRNKAEKFVKAFNEDGRAFIRRSAQELAKDDTAVNIAPAPKRPSRSDQHSTPPAIPEKILRQPKTFDHYVMNLPASATTFLDAFIGVYKGQEQLFSPYTERKLPMIHVHCFSTKSEDNEREKIAICQEISQRIGHLVQPDTPEVQIWDVRAVAPKKRMFCASFRLPPEVAFR